VWAEWESAAPAGGFDAVIGNPPWDRMKLQEVEWFAARVAKIAHAQRAADRKRMAAQLRRGGDPISADYDKAHLDPARGERFYPETSAVLTTRFVTFLASWPA